MPNVPRPAHLADVHESFDVRGELDERAIVGDRDHLPRDARADRVLRGDVLPRVTLELLEAERDALALPINVENLHLELRTDRDHLARMLDSAPRHVRDVEQAVDAAEVDEGAEVRDVLDHALPHLILLELLHQLLTLAGALGLEDHAARHDNVPPALVQLDDLELEFLPEQLVDVRHTTQRDLRTREEGVDAHEVDDHAALDLLDERAFDGRVGLVRDADALPHAHEVGLLLRQDDRALLVLEVLEQDFDFVTRLEIGEVLELFERDRPFGFKTDVEDDHVVADLEHLRADDLAFFDGRERPVVHLHHVLVLGGRVFVLLVELGAPVGERPELGFLDIAFFAGGQWGDGRFDRVGGHVLLLNRGGVRLAATARILGGIQSELGGIAEPFILVM